MELNLTNVIYLFMRLSPLIIVGYFLLQSLFDSSVKGLFYLAGLTITLVVTILASRFNVFKQDADNDSLSSMCKGITLGNGPVSYLPLSQATLIYTLAYLLTIIAKYNTWSINMGTLILFGILIFTDLIWNIKEGCMTILPSGIATWIIAGVIGSFWTRYLLNTGYDITFFHGVSDANVCKMNNSNFRCRSKK